MPFSGTSTVVDPDHPPSMIPVPAKSPAPVDTEIFWLTPLPPTFTSLSVTLRVFTFTGSTFEIFTPTTEDIAL